MTQLRTARAKSARKILSSWKAENLEPYEHDID